MHVLKLQTGKNVRFHWKIFSYSALNKATFSSMHWELSRQIDKKQCTQSTPPILKHGLISMVTSVCKHPISNMCKCMSTCSRYSMTSGLQYSLIEDVLNSGVKFSIMEQTTQFNTLHTSLLSTTFATILLYPIKCAKNKTVCNIPITNLSSLYHGAELFFVSSIIYDCIYTNVIKKQTNCGICKVAKMT